ncbi:cytoplasmic polyadenylation element-binding protein 2 isoform X1 [Crotalus tigris]|uniref:cytoplasmic polyadenylation element-binding protein 2 isoform X1 n=1 Tax=Crotalus tigris TaxID=88082 RepID=UPI00192F88C9|nr:cytoplasmic polyadenylation element-binding protein 2 isoform X1 [Crotalus tigris]
MYDTLNMHSLENSLIDIMRAEHDPLKGCLNYPHLGTDNLLMLNARSYGRKRGHFSRFPIDNGLLDDGHSDQVGVLNSPTCYPAHQNGERIEHFSRKVFVGGLPPDIDEDEITASFRRFGPLVVDWPHKAESKSYFPSKGIFLEIDSELVQIFFSPLFFFVQVYTKTCHGATSSITAHPKSGVVNLWH